MILAFRLCLFLIYCESRRFTGNVQGVVHQLHSALNPDSYRNLMYFIPKVLQSQLMCNKCFVPKVSHQKSPSIPSKSKYIPTIYCTVCDCVV
eukprot:UN07540